MLKEKLYALSISKTNTNDLVEQRYPAFNVFGFCRANIEDQLHHCLVYVQKRRSTYVTLVLFLQITGMRCGIFIEG